MKTVYDFGGDVRLVEYELLGEPHLELLVSDRSISDFSNGEDESLRIEAVKAVLTAFAVRLARLEAGGLQ